MAGLGALVSGVGEETGLALSAETTAVLSPPSQRSSWPAGRAQPVHVGGPRAANRAGCDRDRRKKASLSHQLLRPSETASGSASARSCPLRASQLPLDLLRRAVWETQGALRPQGGMVGGGDQCPCKRDPRPCATWEHSDKVLSVIQEVSAHQDCLCWHLDLGLAASETVRNECRLSLRCPPMLWGLCCHRPNRLRQAKMAGHQPCRSQAHAVGHVLP